ncbi:hypothetical protein [Bacteroides graminisolvens]|uniref:hypothetical protein n=1 Tax=Bacteroides graminisolvens TaxID=477666 RepID=UPI0029C97A73|nr:hypothetical protein [Bacteroides graminisolvens]
MEGLDIPDEEALLKYLKQDYPSELGNLKLIISGNPQYDAACKYTHMIGRIPTKEEFQELIDKCDWEYIETEENKGYKITGLNGNCIYLPLYYTTFVNYMYQTMLTIAISYISGTPKLENGPKFEDSSSYSLHTTNLVNNKRELFITVEETFKKCCYPIRPVLNQYSTDR